MRALASSTVTIDKTYQCKRMAASRDTVIKNALDYLLRERTRATGALINDRGVKAAVLQQDGGYDETFDKLINSGKLQAAVQDARTGNLKKAQSVLESLDSVTRNLYQKHQYALGFDSHHPISLGSSYLLGHDLPMGDAQVMYRHLTDQYGLPLGNPEGKMLTFSDPAHQMAHMDPVTLRPSGWKGFQTKVKPFVEATTDPIERATRYAPMGKLEEAFSNKAFALPQEQNVRRFAGEAVQSSIPNFDPSKISSHLLYPRYKEIYGSGKGTLGRSYAQVARKTLKAEDVAAAQAFGWQGTTSNDLAEELKDVYLRKLGIGEPNATKNTGMPKMERIISDFRPGQLDMLDDLIRVRS